MGIAQYNNECRKIVMRYSTEWEVRNISMNEIVMHYSTEMSAENVIECCIT